MNKLISISIAIIFMFFSGGACKEPSESEVETITVVEMQECGDRGYYSKEAITDMYEQALKEAEQKYYQQIEDITARTWVTAANACYSISGKRSIPVQEDTVFGFKSWNLTSLEETGKEHY